MTTRQIMKALYLTWT